MDKFERDSKFLLGEKIPFLAAEGINDRMMLEMIADDIEDPDPHKQFRAMVAKRLLKFEVSGKRSIQLLDTIVEAAGRIGRTTEEHGDTETLAKLRYEALGTRNQARRAHYATQLGDRGLQFASGWGGRHIRRIMKEDAALKYCLDQARFGYELAADALNKTSHRDNGWVHGLGLLAPNILTAQRVLFSFHDPESDTPIPSSPFLH